MRGGGKKVDGGAGVSPCQTIKSRRWWTVRVFRRAQRREIRIGGGERLKLLFERDRAVDAHAGGFEVAALARIAAEIELDRRFFRMQPLRFDQDSLGGGERFGAAGRISPSHPRTRRICLPPRPFASGE